MKPRHLLLAPFLLPALRPAAALAELGSQSYDTSYQSYKEDSERMHITSFYLRGKVDVNAETSFRFQYLRDAISGSSPGGALYNQTELPFLTEVDDIRTAFVAALAHQFGDHRVELELSQSDESDYNSTGVSLSDAWELNQKNTTVAFGVNYLSDLVEVRGYNPQDKAGFDFFTGVTQIIDKNTVVSANLTLGTSNGYLNDPYKGIQRTDVTVYDDGTVSDPYLNLYPENRPTYRFRQVLQLQGTHFFAPANGALDAVYRLSNDDYGVFSQTVQLEWRQAIGEKFEVIPYFRYYRQTAADFFMSTLDGVKINSPDISHPNGSGANYSADYRLSSLDTLSLGLKLRYQITDSFAANVSYERYSMSGNGSDSAPSQAYPEANMFGFCLGAKF